MNDGDTVIQKQVVRCESDNGHYFSYTIYGLQGLLLLFGAFLAWETRKVKTDRHTHTHHFSYTIYGLQGLLLLFGAFLA